MSITDLVNKLIDLGWYVKAELYLDSNASDDGIVTFAVPAMSGEAIYSLPGWPTFTFHQRFETWSCLAGSQVAIDWLKQAVSA